MAEFSIQDMAFTGFRVVREHPGALGAWALYALLLSVVFSLVFVGLMGPDFMKLVAASTEGTKDPATMVALLGRLAPGYLVVAIVALAANSVLAAAMIRAVIHPHDDRFGYLRMGVDELRQLGLWLLTFLVFLAAYLGACVLLGLVAAVVASVAKVSGTGVFVALFVALGVTMMLLAVRLSLAPALTFDGRRIDLFGSWALTRGRFWPLFGTYVLTLALILVVYLLGLLVTFALAALLNGGDPGAAMAAPDMSSLKAYYTPARVAQMVMGACVSALVWPVLFTPSTAIYRSLRPAAGDAVA